MKQYFKMLMLLTGVLAISNLVVSCDDDEKNVPVTEISLDKANLSMSKGTRKSLEVRISPNDASNKSVVWTSSDETVATIDRGVITTLKKGKTIITAKLADGGLIATCELTVTDWAKIVLTTAKSIGETLSLELLANFENQEFIWIDLNDNGVKDEGEGNIKFSSFGYDYNAKRDNDNSLYPKTNLPIGAKKITIYGELTYLGCADNQITDLDFSQNTTLKYLECDNNQLRKLDIAKLKDLGSLVCANNKIENLDFSNIKYIEYLDCSKNQLSALDCSDTFLKVFDCSENQLEILNFATGLNNIIGKFNATKNPNLTCIQVDKDFMPPSTWNKDEDVTWNNSGSACVSIEDKEIIYPASMKLERIDSLSNVDSTYLHFAIRNPYLSLFNKEVRLGQLLQEDSSEDTQILDKFIAEKTVIGFNYPYNKDFQIKDFPIEDKEAYSTFVADIVAKYTSSQNSKTLIAKEKFSSLRQLHFLQMDKFQHLDQTLTGKAFSDEDSPNIHGDYYEVEQSKFSVFIEASHIGDSNLENNNLCCNSVTFGKYSLLVLYTENPRLSVSGLLTKLVEGTALTSSENNALAECTIAYLNPFEGMLAKGEGTVEKFKKDLEGNDGIRPLYCQAVKKNGSSIEYVAVKKTIVITK